MEAVCRAVLSRRLQSVCRITEASGRQYHGCPTIARLRRARASGTPQLLVFNVRHQSTVTTAASQIPVVIEAQLPPSPPPLTSPEAILPPPISDIAPTVTETLGQVEQSLSELGLGGYSPSGLVQKFMELLHVDVGLPWWGTIVTATVLVRILVFPLMVKGLRFSAKLNNHMPQITAMTAEMNEAKRSGNMFEFSKAYSNLTLYQKKHDVYPLRGFLVPMIQAPVFISFFVALRQMSYLPVPSMHTGGLWWFADLTVADPYYILPLLSASSLWIVLELGAETGVSNPNFKMMKNVFRVMPFFVFFFTMDFPTAIFAYWATSNFFSVAQVAFLKIPAVRKKLKIPEQIKRDDPSVLPDDGGFIKSLQKAFKSAKLANQLEDRQYKMKHHLDIAAKGPLRQTFAENPLQQREKTPVPPKTKTKNPMHGTFR